MRAIYSHFPCFFALVLHIYVGAFSWFSTFIGPLKKRIIYSRRISYKRAFKIKCSYFFFFLQLPERVTFKIDREKNSDKSLRRKQYLTQTNDKRFDRVGVAIYLNFLSQETRNPKQTSVLWLSHEIISIFSRL